MKKKTGFIVPQGFTSEIIKKIGEEIGEMITACETEKDNFRPVWKQVDRSNRNQTEDSLEKPWPGAPTYQIAVVGPRIERATAFIVGPMTAALPWWLVRAGGPAAKRIDSLETVLHYHLKRAKYGLHVRQAVTLAQLRGKSVIMPYFEAGEGSYGASDGVSQPAHLREEPGKAKRPKLCLRAIDVQDHVVYPNYATLIEDCVMTGHRFAKPAQWVEEKQKAGEYFPDVVVRGGSQLQRGGGDSALDKNSQGSNAMRPEHQAVEIYQVVALLDPLKTGKHAWYLIELYKDRNAVLRIESYRYSRPWYFDVFLNQEYGRLLNENSRGRNLMGPQMFTRDVVHMQVWGSYQASNPITFADKWALPEDVSSVPPGAIVPMEGGGGSVHQLQSKYDAGAFPGLTQYAREMADDVGGVSGQGMGAPLKTGHTTATESQNAAQGQMMGVDEDAANVAFGLTDMVEFIVGDLLFQHYNEWAPAYEGVLPETKIEDFAQLYWFEINGQTPLNTPQAKQQAIVGLSQLLTALGPDAMPKIEAANPNFAVDIVRAYIQNSEIDGKDSIMPTEEEMQMIAQQASQQPKERPPEQQPDYDHAGPFVRAQMEHEAGFSPDPPMLGANGQTNPSPDGGLLQLSGVGAPSVPVDPGGTGNPAGPTGP